MNTVIVGVGSNIRPDLNIPKARELLSREQHLVKESAFTTTPPIGFADQPDFVNGALLIETAMEREAFVQYLKDLEDRIGRVRTGDKYGPRTIDLDVIVWNGSIVSEDYYARDFVRRAANELVS